MSNISMQGTFKCACLFKTCLIKILIGSNFPNITTYLPCCNFCLYSPTCTPFNGMWLFITVQWVGLWCVIVVFPDHTHLLYVRGLAIFILLTYTVIDSLKTYFCISLHQAIILTFRDNNFASHFTFDKVSHLDGQSFQSH